jgi:hypothetical protein
VAGLLVAGVIAWRAPNQYSSTAVLQMAPGEWDERVDRLNQAEQDILSRRSLSGMIQQYDLYPNERKKAPLEDIVQEMRNKHIQIRLLNAPKTDAPARAFSVSFESDNPEKALGVTTELTDRFTAAMKDTAPLELLDPASRPMHAFEPNRPAMLMAGLLLGLATGLVLVGIRRWPLIPLAGLGVATLVLPATYLIPNVYRSMAVLRSKTEDPGLEARKVVSDRAYLQGLIARFGLYPQERNPVDQMQKSLMVRDLVVPNRKICTVQFDYSDRYKAQAVLRDIVAKVGVDVLDPASLPERAFTPNRLALVMTALFVGLLTGAIALAVRRRRVPALAS